MSFDPLKLLDLRGRDGRISFTKALIVALLVAYWTGAPIPELVATTMIGASFGRTWVQSRREAAAA